MRLKELLESSDKILILTHRHADTDAIASINYLAKYLRKILNKKVTIYIPERISKNTRTLLDKLNYKIDYTCSLSDVISDNYDLAVILDTSSASQLNTKLHNFKVKNFVIIDHHYTHDEEFLKINTKIVDKDASSTSELIYLILKNMDYVSYEDIDNILLIAGILTDSGRLSRARVETFQVLAELLSRCGLNYEEICRLVFSREIDWSERIARIKGILRMRVFKTNHEVLCVSHVSAYESSLAKVMHDCGCDLVFILSEHDDEFRIVGRARNSKYIIPEILQKFVQIYEGVGGGHLSAGVVIIKKSNVEKLSLEELIDNFIKFLTRYFKNVKEIDED